MSRLMSVAFTEQAVVERRKTVTRRKGWLFLRPGDQLTLVRKSMGRKPGEPLVRLAEVEVVSVRREPLFHVMGARELTAEGFPEWESDHDSSGANEFMRRYFEPQGIKPYQDVTRIRWRYLDTFTRPSTDTVRLPEGGCRITVKRCCDGCGRELGDATAAELDAAYAGRLLPSVVDECGRHNDQTTILLDALGSAVDRAKAARRSDR